MCTLISKRVTGQRHQKSALVELYVPKFKQKQNWYTGLKTGKPGQVQLYTAETWKKNIFFYTRWSFVCSSGWTSKTDRNFAFIYNTIIFFPHPNLKMYVQTKGNKQECSRSGLVLLVYNHVEKRTIKFYTKQRKKKKKKKKKEWTGDLAGCLLVASRVLFIHLWLGCACLCPILCILTWSPKKVERLRSFTKTQLTLPDDLPFTETFECTRLASDLWHTKQDNFIRRPFWLSKCCFLKSMNIKRYWHPMD